MPNLLGLPNELLLKIAETVLPDDIENFSQSCELTHSLSKDALREHAANKQKFSKLILSGVGATLEENRAIHPVMMIRELLQNDRVAFYPTEVVIKNMVDGYLDEDFSSAIDPLDVTKSQVSTILAQYDAEIFTLLSNCPYLKSSEVVKWHQSIRQQIDAAAIAILLTVLPNVERIKIYSFDTNFLGKMIDRVTRAIYNLSSEVGRPTALSKVFDVTIVGNGSLPSQNPLDWTDLGLLGVFAALPSIRRINGLRVNGQKFRPRQPPGGILVPYSPSLRELNFTDSLIGQQTLRQILHNIKNLQRFTYSYDLFIGNQSSMAQPNEIAALLRTYARSSLVELHISDSCRRRVSSFDESFRAFAALERISVDAQLFIKDKDSFRKPQLLTEMLPASIKELELIGPIDEEEVSLMFSGLFTSEKLFPNLCTIVLNPWVRLSKTVRAECKAAGISLEIANRDGLVGPSRWKYVEPRQWRTVTPWT